MVTSRLPTVAESIGVVTTLGGFFAKPSLLSGLKAGGSLYEAMLKLAQDPPPSLARVAADIEALADQTFDAMGREVPDDARRIFSQMVEAAVVTAEGAIGADLKAETIVTTMLDGMTDTRSRDANMQMLFRMIATPALDRVLTDPTVTAGLTPQVFSALLERMTRIDEQLATLTDRYGSLASALVSVQNAKRDALEAIATRFRIPDAFDRTDQELRQLLFKKAEDVRSMEAVVAGIDDRTIRLTQLKADAEAARENLDLGALAEAFKRVDQAETEKSAETKVALAHVQLGLGQIDAAVRTLSAAADSFASANPLAPARMRYNYMEILVRHGERYGGPAFDEGIAMITAALDRFPRDAHVKNWSAMKMRLGLALDRKAMQSEAARQEALTCEAIDAYRAALDGLGPEDWQILATTKTNLATSLVRLVNFTPPAERIELLFDAMQAIKGAMAVRTKEMDLRGYSITEQTYGLILTKMAELVEPGEAKRLLSEATAAFDAAAKGLWKMNDAHGAARTAMMAAETGVDIARLEPTRARSHLTQTRDVVDWALTILDRDNHPLEHAAARESRARIEAALSAAP